MLYILLGVVFAYFGGWRNANLCADRTSHWSSQSWRDYWLDAISICLARGRGQIGTAVARTDVFHRQATHSVSGSEGEAS